MSSRVVHHLDQDPTDREVEVAPGIVIVHVADMRRAGGHHSWAVRHACPGIWREDESAVYISAPFIASDLVSEEPLTFSPSILCMGAGRPCGLHGFVVNGQWQDAGTPAETMAHIVAEASR